MNDLHKIIDGVVYTKHVSNFNVGDKWRTRRGLISEVIEVNEPGAKIVWMDSVREQYTTNLDGLAYGTGFAISWQHGPLGRGADRREPNGAFVEDVILAAADRIRYYQSGRFACERNAKALQHLEAALAELAARTNDRQARNVEGTYET